MTMRNSCCYGWGVAQPEVALAEIFRDYMGSFHEIMIHTIHSESYSTFQKMVAHVSY